MLGWAMVRRKGTEEERWARRRVRGAFEARPWSVRGVCGDR